MLYNKKCSYTTINLFIETQNPLRLIKFHFQQNLANKQASVIFFLKKTFIYNRVTNQSDSPDDEIWENRSANLNTRSTQKPPHSIFILHAVNHWSDQ